MGQQNIACCHKGEDASFQKFTPRQSLKKMQSDMTFTMSPINKQLDRLDSQMTVRNSEYEVTGEHSISHKELPTAKFAIVSDIDGVLTFNSEQVGNTDRVLQQLLTNSSETAPIYLASNNGGFTEQLYASRINKRMNSKTEIQGDSVILCHTPLRNYSMRDTFKNQVVLMTSRNESEGMNLLKEYGYTQENQIQVITLMEYACLFSTPMSSWLIELPQLQEYFFEVDNGQKYGSVFPTCFEKVAPFLKNLQMQLMVRFEFVKDQDTERLSDDEFQALLLKFKNQFKISAAIIMVEILNWSIGKQVLTDLVASRDGMPHKLNNVRTVYKNADGTVKSVEPQFVKIYFMGGADFVYPNKFPATILNKNSIDSQKQMEQSIPRYGIGAFVYGWTEQYKYLFGYAPDIIQYGKPYIKHMKFIEEYVLRSHQNVQTIYMIGDNLSTDVLGANTIAKHNNKLENQPKWVSIAVKSGIFQNNKKDMGDIAKNGLLKPGHIVEDFEAAVQLIQKLEGTSLYHEGLHLDI